MSKEFKNVRLTQIHEEQMDMDEMEDFSTASMVEYGLRNGGTDAEYHLANRLQKLRHVALRLAKAIEGNGGMVTDIDWQAIDVMAEVVEEKRLFRTEQ
jgi:hypothetical protein